MEVHAFRALTPGALAGKAPKSYGTGRRCACGTKIMQYRKGDVCGLCEKNPERLQGALERQQEYAVFGDKWKSKEYPDGCPECPPGNRFMRRHAGRGLCSTHYQRALKDEKRGITTTAFTGNGTETVELEDATGKVLIDDSLLPGEKIELDDEPSQITEELFVGEPHPGTVRLMQIVDTGVDYFATAAEIKAGIATRTLDHDLEPVYRSNPEGCPKDAHETCCFDPDECNPGQADEGQPEPGDDISYSEYLTRQHSDALAEHFDTAARAEAALGVFNELTALAREQAQTIQAITNQLHAEGIHVAVEPALLQGGYQPDAEVEAMERLRVALEPLDRDAQIRAVKWVTARFEIDRPLPNEGNEA